MKKLARVAVLLFLAIMATDCVKEKELKGLPVDQTFWSDLHALEKEFLDLAGTETRREFLDGSTGKRHYFYGWKLDELLAQRNKLLQDYGCYIYNGGWWVNHAGPFIDVDYDCPQDPKSRVKGTFVLVFLSSVV